MKWNPFGYENIRKKPWIILDLWFVFVLPLMLGTKYMDRDWLGIAMFLAFSGIMWATRIFSMEIHKTNQRVQEDSDRIRKELGENYRTVRVSLSEEDFKNLVRGKVAKPKTLPHSPKVEMILSDIGYSAMLHAIHDAVEELAFKEEECQKPSKL